MLRDILVILAVCVVLAGAALAVQRLLVPRQPDTSGIAANLDRSLGSLVREQVQATQKVLDVEPAQDDLDRILQRLQSALPEPRPDLQVLVVQSPVVNAFTIPGDTIFVDTALIQALDSADELAGVLGHEASHAVNRDPLTMLMRRLGMAALVNAVSGGRGAPMLSDMAQTMIDVRYGREAEDRADAFSVRVLASAGNPHDSFARALERIRDSAPKEPELLKYLDPHSPIDQRTDRARELARRQSFTPRPLRVDWDRLLKSLPKR